MFYIMSNKYHSPHYHIPSSTLRGLHLDELDRLALRLPPCAARTRGAQRQGGRGTTALGALGVVGDAPQNDLDPKASQSQMRQILLM